jgi:hypothetical protein
MNHCVTNTIRGAFVCSILFVAGCASSELVDVWHDSSYHAPPFNTVLVISVSRTPMERHMWEDAFAGELSKHGIVATPSYRSFPEAVPDTNQVIQIVKSDGFDGILICRRLPSQMKAEYSQGWVSLEKDVTLERHTRYDRRWERFVTYYRDVNQADYVDSEMVDIRAIDVWATRNEGQMIWSATSKSPEPNSLHEVKPEVVNLVMTELKRKNIIAPKH